MNDLENSLTAMVQRLVQEEVARQSPQQEPKETPPKFLGVDGVSKMTGYKKNTIYKMVNERKIPYYKNNANGRKLMFLAEEIEAWLAGQRVGTTAEFVAEKMGGVAI